MRLSELKDMIEKDLQEIGDLEVFIMDKNILSGITVKNAQEVVLMKLSREDKEPYVAFAISSCIAEPTREASRDETIDMLKGCATSF